MGSRKLIELCNKVSQTSAARDEKEASVLAARQRLKEAEDALHSEECRLSQAMTSLEEALGCGDPVPNGGRGPDEVMRAQRADLGPRPSRIRVVHDGRTATHPGPLEWYYRAYASQAAGLGVGTPGTHRQEDGVVRDGVWLTADEHQAIKEDNRA